EGRTHIYARVDADGFSLTTLTRLTGCLTNGKCEMSDIKSGPGCATMTTLKPDPALEEAAAIELLAEAKRQGSPRSSVELAARAIARPISLAVCRFELLFWNCCVLP